MARKSPKQMRERRLASAEPEVPELNFVRQKLREMEERSGKRVRKRPMPQAPSELYPGGDPENVPYRLVRRKRRGGTYA